MANALAQRIDRLTRRRQRDRWIAALARVAAVAVGAALLVMVIDYLWRSPDRGLRWLALAGVAGAVAAAARGWLLPVARRPDTAGGVAESVQRRFPELGSRLASALEFLEQPTEDPRAGSAELRRAVVLETANQVEPLPIEQVHDTRPLRRGVAAALVAVLAAAGFFAADGAGFGVAATRLLAPWTDCDWPRRHKLVVAEAPTRIAKGQPFRAVVADANGPLPDDLTILYRSDFTGGQRIDEQPLAAEPDDPQRALAERDNVQLPFAYRLVGGDDTAMPWRGVEVVDPPPIDALTLRQTPPTYSGLPAGEFSGEIGGYVRVLSGTTIGLAARSPAILSAAAVETRFGDAEAELAAAVEPLPGGGSSVEIAGADWQAEAQGAEPALGSFRLRVETAEGLVGRTPRRLLRIEPDTPPTVAWETPSTDLFVTRRAAAPIAVRVEDNLAVQRVELVVVSAAAGDDGGEPSPSVPEVSPTAESPLTVAPIARVEIGSGPEEPPQRPEGLSFEGESRRVETQWLLETLDLAIGDQLVLTVEATDYRPGVGVTPTSRRVTIISEAELETRIADAAAALARDLERVLGEQRDARAGAEQLAIEQRTGQPIDRSALDRLATLGYQQREIATGLGDPGRGAAAQAEAILDEIRSNRLDRPDLSEQLREVAEELRRLGDGPLPDAQRGLADAARAATRGVEGPNDSEREAVRQELSGGLADAGSAQEQAIASLESMVDSLGRWSDLQRFTREVAELEEQQRGLAADARRQAAKDAGAQAEGGASQRADREKLAASQAELGRRFDRLQQAMREQLATPGDAGEQPNAREGLQPIEDALAESEDRATGGKMTGATQQLARGQLGRAAEQQRSAAEDLKEMLDTLRDRASSDPAELADQLREAQQRLSELQRQTTDESGSPADAGQADRRERLADRAERLGRRLERLDAPEAGASTGRGSQQLSESAAQSSSPSQPSSNSVRSQQSMQQAEEELERAQRQLAERIDQLEDEVAEGVLQRLAGKIEGYLDRQRQVLEGTVVAEEAAAAERRQSTATLAGDQRTLEVEIAAAAEELSTRAVFAKALGAAAGEMRDAAERLDNADAGRQTQRRELGALQRLQHVAQVLRPDPNEPPPGSQPPSGQGGQGGPGGQPPEPPPIAVAELKMLRLMQLGVNARTRELAADAGLLAREDAQQQAAELAGEQAELTELVRELSARNNAATPPDSPAEIN